MMTTAEAPEVEPMVVSYTPVTATPFMPTRPFLAVGVATGVMVQFECAANSVSVAPEQDSSTFETYCGAYTAYGPERWTITASVYMSYGTTTGLWDLLRPLCNTEVDYEFRPSSAAASATNQKMTGRCRLNGFAYYDMTANEPNEIDVVLTVLTYAWSPTP